MGNHTSVQSGQRQQRAPVNIYLPDSRSNLWADGTWAWPIIQRELQKLIDQVTVGEFNAQDFPDVIAGYNPGHPYGFAAIIKLLSTEPKYIQLLPRIARLVLSIQDTVTRRPIPLLRKGVAKSVSLTQQEIATLLACAFFCAYPKRDLPYPDFERFPPANFFQLFMNDRPANLEKLKCFLHYFEEIGKRERPGTVLTFERRTLTASHVPNWRTSTKPLTPTTISADGTIEDDGRGMLQVDFANELVGGGILRSGASQEEIRYCINPELLASVLFTEELNDDEVLVMTGSERFSNYTGYSSTFKYAGPHNDTVPLDSRGRRQTQIVAMDALMTEKFVQFRMHKVDRELTKAFSAFLFRGTFKTPIATGKWGCGAFNGNPTAKFLIQLMAASEAERELHFFTFGDTGRDEEKLFVQIYDKMKASRTTVGRLYTLFESYSREVEQHGPNVIDFETFVNENI